VLMGPLPDLSSQYIFFSSSVVYFFSFFLGFVSYYYEKNYSVLPGAFWIERRFVLSSCIFLSPDLSHVFRAFVFGRSSADFPQARPAFPRSFLCRTHGLSLPVSLFSSMAITLLPPAPCPRNSLPFIVVGYCTGLLLLPSTIVLFLQFFPLPFGSIANGVYVNSVSTSPFCLSLQEILCGQLIFFFAASYGGTSQLCCLPGVFSGVIPLSFALMAEGDDSLGLDLCQT